MVTEPKEIHAWGAPALGALRLLHPDQWRARIRAALAAAGSTRAAAPTLGVGLRTLERWVAEVPALAEGLELRGRGWEKGVKRGPRRAKKKHV
jgi:hypothetical protein